MNFHPRVVQGLTPHEIDILSDAVDMVDDYLLEELTEKRYADNPRGGGAFSGRFLPERHRDLYDFKMIRRFHTSLVVVTGRLRDGWRPQTCRAEELVTAAIIEQAKLLHEETSERPSDAIDYLYETLFEDLDHQYTFDPAYDGIDDPDTYEGSQMRTGPLHPTTWFEPVRGDRPVHPLTAGTTAMSRRAPITRPSRDGG